MAEGQAEEILGGCSLENVREGRQKDVSSGEQGWKKLLDASLSSLLYILVH